MRLRSRSSLAGAPLGKYGFFITPLRPGPFITWGKPVLPKVMKNRLHLHLAPEGDTDQQEAVARLVSVGATRVDAGRGDVDRVVLTDPDGNEFCVLREG